MDHDDPTWAGANTSAPLGPCLMPTVLASLAATGFLGLPAWAAVKISVPLATVAAPWWYTAVLTWAVAGLPVGLLCTTALWRRSAKGPGTKLLNWVAAIGTAGAPLSLLPLSAALAVGILPHASWLHWYGPLLAGMASLICAGAAALGLLACRHGAKITGGPVTTSGEQASLWIVFAIAVLGLPISAAGSNLATAGLAPSAIGDLCVMAGLAAPIFAPIWLLRLEGVWKRCGFRLRDDIRARGAIWALMATWATLAWLLFFGT